MALYIQDADLTAGPGMPADFSSTDLSTASKRSTYCITPASAWIESVYPYDYPFTAAPSAPALIRIACLEYAIFLAHSILGVQNKADAAMKRAVALLQIDEKTGLARAPVPGVHNIKRVRVFDIARSLDAEDRDFESDEQALYP